MSLVLGPYKYIDLIIYPEEQFKIDLNVTADIMIFYIHDHLSSVLVVYSVFLSPYLAVFAFVLTGYIHLLLYFQ